MTHSANTMRTTVGGRAASLAALAALLVVLASADAAMRVSPQGFRVAAEGRPARTSVAGLSRMVEGLLACAAVPDAGQRLAPVPTAHFVPLSAQVSGPLPAMHGLHELLDLPPPAMA